MSKEVEEYRDTGCNLAPSCLSCPLRRCKYDQPRHKQASGRQNERRRKIRALLDEGMTIAEIAERLDISMRTAYRERRAA